MWPPPEKLAGIGPIEEIFKAGVLGDEEEE